ncbi:MAG: branched-chain amino acid ABC transporter permease [Firmicutes bacterium]|nr:branched-chain amino acid ABC transporter permease [Bacillota bacterium]
MLAQQFVSGIVIGGVYALIAMGLTLVYGVLRILHVAHAAVYATGAYVGLITFQRTDNLWLGLAAAAVFCGLFGVMIHRFVYGPLLDQPRIVPLIASIGLFIFSQDFLRLLFGPYAMSFPASVPFGLLELGDAVIPGRQVFILAVTAVLLALTWYVVGRTRLGLAWTAVSQDAETAVAMGVNVPRVVAFNFLFGSSIAAIAGILVGMHYNSVYPAMGEMPAYKMLAVVVLGGLGSVPGTVVAAFLLGLVETLLVGFAGFVLPRDAIAFVALIAILLLRPEGLFGRSDA